MALQGNSLQPSVSSQMCIVKEHNSQTGRNLDPKTAIPCTKSDIRRTNKYQKNGGWFSGQKFSKVIEWYLIIEMPTLLPQTG